MILVADLSVRKLKPLLPLFNRRERREREREKWGFLAFILPGVRVLENTAGGRWADEADGLMCL
jgi:hypothetical protein